MDPKSPKKIVLIIAVLVLCFAGIVLNVVALATDHWLLFHGTYLQDNSTTDKYSNNWITVDINCGLFKGQVAKCCLPTVTNAFSLKDEYYNNNDFMSFALWVSTLLFLALGITFGCIGAVFAGINAVITPIEIVTGIVGLYLWNGLACLFCVVSLISWLVQYLSYLSDIAETLRNRYNFGRMDNKATPNFSCFLVVVASVIYLLNNLLVYLSTRSWDKKKNSELTNEPANGVIMLY